MSDSSLDPYDILGVAASATLTEIKRAFRTQAARFHPDRNPDPEAPLRFRQAQQAYELLSDDALRHAHDLRRQKHLLEDSRATARMLFETYVAEIE